MYNLISDDYGVLSYGKLFFLGGVVLFLIGCIEFTLKAWFASNEEIENKLRNTLWGNRFRLHFFIFMLCDFL